MNAKKISPLAKELKPEQLLRQLNTAEGKLAEAISRWAGSMSFVYIHVLWFSFWILANHGILAPLIPIFDPFPYGLLTMIVSLEAIFLATFIMIAQNRQALLDTYRELEEEREQAIEEKEQEALEQDVEEISQDVDEISKDVDKIQAGLNDLMKAVSQMHQRIISVEKKRTQFSSQENQKAS